MTVYEYKMSKQKVINFSRIIYLIKSWNRQEKIHQNAMIFKEEKNAARQQNDNHRVEHF